jgi:hypothetical protein
MPPVRRTVGEAARVEHRSGIDARRYVNPLFAINGRRRWAVVVVVMLDDLALLHDWWRRSVGSRRRRSVILPVAIRAEVGSEGRAGEGYECRRQCEAFHGMLLMSSKGSPKLQEQS